MKNFASASFFRVFDHRVRPPSLSGEDVKWSVEGVDWTRTRHSVRNSDYGVTTEVFIGSQTGRKPWKIMIVHETWWVGAKRDAVRAGHWAHFVSGDRAAAMAWFKELEGIDRTSFVAARSGFIRPSARDELS